MKSQYVYVKKWYGAFNPKSIHTLFEEIEHVPFVRATKKELKYVLSQPPYKGLKVKIRPVQIRPLDNL